MALNKIIPFSYYIGSTFLLGTYTCIKEINTNSSSSISTSYTFILDKGNIPIERIMIIFFLLDLSNFKKQVMN